MFGTKREAVAAGLIALVAASAAIGIWVVLHGRGESTLAVVVRGRTLHVAVGTTVDRLGLRPPAGDLLDVEGRVLQAGAVPGSLLVDGRPVPAGTRLRAGDRVSVVAGRDRREPLQRRVVRLPGGLPSNPQFFLTRTPGTLVVVRGAISHKLLSTTFRPRSGHARVERAVALTFDDGPSPRDTPRILAELKRLHVRATFFVVGYLADSYPDLVRRELRAGMTVGSHSYNHPEVPPFDQLPQPLLDDEIGLAAQSLRRAGARPKLFRPPGGSYSPGVVAAARAQEERIVLWSVDPADWQPGMTARRITANVLAAVKPGSIVILHDGGGDRSATVAALPRIVKGIRRRHLRLVAIPTVEGFGA